MHHTHLTIRRRHRGWRGRLAAFMVTPLAGLGLAVAATAPAQAASPTVQAGVNLRPCVDTNNGVCAPVGTTDGGTLYKLRCWRDGSTATGTYTSQRWFLVSLRNGQEGYVHSSFVTNQVSVPACSTLSYVRAADFALGLVGQTYANPNVRDYYATSDWSPGPKGEWSGDCAKLTGASWELGAGVGYRKGNAIVQYRGYAADGKIVSGIPRYGEPVFYDIAAPYGHTAIYVGGLTIVTTQGMDNAGLPVVRKGLNDYPNYLGWASL